MRQFYLRFKKTVSYHTGVYTYTLLATDVNA